MMDAAPTEIRLRTQSRLLVVTFADGQRYELPFEYLRVFSPSAEVQGHGPSQRITVTGKQDVGIHDVEPIGHYAVRLSFDDGHNTGLFTWKYLRELGARQQANWAEYLQRVAAMRRSGGAANAAPAKPTGPPKK